MRGAVSRTHFCAPALFLAIGALCFSLWATGCGPGPAPADVLENQVLAEIHADVRIAPYEVQVEVTRVDPGHVTLSGSVDRPEVKRLAAEIAQGVAGVDRVDNRIEVRGPRAGS